MNQRELSGILNAYNVPKQMRDMVLWDFANLAEKILWKDVLLGELHTILLDLQEKGAVVRCPLCFDELDDCIFCEDCHWGFA